MKKLFGFLFSSFIVLVNQTWGFIVLCEQQICNKIESNKPKSLCNSHINTLNPRCLILPANTEDLTYCGEHKDVSVVIGQLWNPDVA